MNPWTEQTYTDLRAAIVRSAVGRQEALGLVVMLRAWLRDVKANLNKAADGYVPDGAVLEDGNAYTWAMLDALDAAFTARDSHTADALCSTAEAHSDLFGGLPVREVV